MIEKEILRASLVTPIPPRLTHLPLFLASSFSPTPPHPAPRPFVLQEIRNPLEPLLIRLIKGYVDDADLTRRLKTLYQVMCE